MFDCSFKIIVSINGFAINFVIQNVEFVETFAGNGEYNFNIIESTTSNNIVLPKSSVDFSDSVHPSFSQVEINICSLLPKLARCVKYLLSLSGSINLRFPIKAS